MGRYGAQQRPWQHRRRRRFKEITVIQIIGLIVATYCAARLLQMIEESARAKNVVLVLLFIVAFVAIAYLGIELLTAPLPSLPESQ